MLTFTNQLTDALVRRIMVISKQDKGYEEWLGCFYGIGDEEIEQSPAFRDKTFDIRTLLKNSMVMAMARFLYDFFMLQRARVFLNGIKLDDFIFDETSTTPLAIIQKDT